SLTTVVRKMRRPHTIGDDHPRPGRSAFHTTFFVVLHSSGMPRSSATPPDGPRNCGQLVSARLGSAITIAINSVSNARRIGITPGWDVSTVPRRTDFSPRCMVHKPNCDCYAQSQSLTRLRVTPHGSMALRHSFRSSSRMTESCLIPSRFESYANHYGGSKCVARIGGKAKLFSAAAFQEIRTLALMARRHHNLRPGVQLGEGETHEWSDHNPAIAR